MRYRIAIISNVMPLVEPLAESAPGLRPRAGRVAAGAQGGGGASAAAVGRGLGQHRAAWPEHLARARQGRGRAASERLDLDVTLCWGFSWKLPQEALDIPRLGSVNQHPGRLPRHRGPYPMAWALRDGDDVFGVTWHRMDADYDTGPILAETTTPSRTRTRRSTTSASRCCPRRSTSCRASSSASKAQDPGDPQSEDGAGWAGAFDEDYAVGRLDAAGGDDPRPGTSLAPHVRQREGAGADRGTRRRAHEAPPDEPDRPRRGRPVPSSAATGVCGSSSPSRRYLTRKLPIMSCECGSQKYV